MAKPGKFELANGGTLLLDEIGEMPLSLQPKLLRVLQEREIDRLGDTRTVRVDVRVIATTNKSLKSRWRTDNSRGFVLPAQRGSADTAGVVRAARRYFATCETFCCEIRRERRRQRTNDIGGVRSLSGSAELAGNVRELENFIRRALALSSGPMLEAADMESGLERVEEKRTGLQPE